MASGENAKRGKERIGAWIAREHDGDKNKSFGVGKCEQDRELEMKFGKIRMRNMGTWEQSLTSRKCDKT